MIIERQETYGSKQEEKEEVFASHGDLDDIHWDTNPNAIDRRGAGSVTEWDIIKKHGGKESLECPIPRRHRTFVFQITIEGIRLSYQEEDGEGRCKGLRCRNLHLRKKDYDTRNKGTMSWGEAILDTNAK